jgi:hypothetical protein
VALIGDELRARRLLAPIPEPVLKARGYSYMHQGGSGDAPVIAALQKWLIDAGSVTESRFSTYLSTN